MNSKLNKNEIERFSRQIILKNIGALGQKKIKDAMTSISSSDYHMFSIPLNVSIDSGLNWGEAH